MSDSPAAAAIHAAGLVKRFGALAAVDGIDLSVAPGESVAVFGPNGAGKTTLIRLLTGALRADAGRFRIHGLDSRKDDLEVRRRCGLISHQSFLYGDLSARQNLEFFGALHGVEDPPARARELLATIDLSYRAEDPLRTFSRGMRQRVSLARALVHDPTVVFLDEPFTGLDPFAAETLRRTLESLRSRGRSLLLVTHNVREGLALSDRWILLSRGRVADGGASAATAPDRFEASSFRSLAGQR